MIEWIVSSSALILLITAIRFLFRNRLALRARYALWLLVVLRLLVPVPFLESSISILNLLEMGKAVMEAGAQPQQQTNRGTAAQSREQTAAEAAAQPQEQTVTGEGNQLLEPAEGSGQTGAVYIGAEGAADKGHLQGAYPPESGISAGDGAERKETEVPVSGNVDRLLFGIWLSGAVLCAAIVAVGNFCYRKRLYRSRKPCQPCMESRLPVYISPVVSIPCLFGLVHPAIYLTSGAASLCTLSSTTGNHGAETSGAMKGREALGYVLSHENTHYRHRDNLWAMVRTACICVHWFNPLVWLAARLSRQDCELACDEEVLKPLGEKERIAYGRALLAFSVQDNDMLGSLQYATTISGGKKQLKERLMIIVQRPRRSSAALVWSLILALLVSTVTFTGKMEVQASIEEEAGNSGISREARDREPGGEPEEEPWTEPYVKEVSFALGDDRDYVLQISGGTVPGTGEYQTGQITLFWIRDGGREMIQTIRAGDAKVLYTRPAGASEPFSDNTDGGWPWIFSSETEALFAKPLCTLEELPANAVRIFEEAGGGEMQAYAPDGGIIVADLNFDGYNDFCMQAGIGSVNVPYYCYLWNPEEGRFEPDCMIPNVQVNEETRLIESLTKDGEGVYSIKYYRFDQENILHLVRYVEENQSPDAIFPLLDLTYCEDGYYTLPAVDNWDYLTEYGGALVERLIYWAKQALTELYEWSGTKIDKTCFSTSYFGDFFFGNSPEDVRTSRTFYSRAYGAKAGFIDCIESMYVVTEREAWYSDVTQWNVPDNLSEMTDLQLVEWYFGYSALTKGEAVADIEESYENAYVVRTESGRYYELTLNPITREVGSVYGPYDHYPVH